MDRLLFADSKVFALLKEAVMDFERKMLGSAPAGHINENSSNCDKKEERHEQVYNFNPLKACALVNLTH
jgi:hypothetical protein